MVPPLWISLDWYSSDFDYNLRKAPALLGVLVAIFLSLIFIVMDSMRGTVYNFTAVKLSNKWKNVNSEMKCGGQHENYSK